MSAVNQTNLALKGIIGIGAMAKISSAIGQSDDADHYQVGNLVTCAFYLRTRKSSVTDYRIELYTAMANLSVFVRS